MCSARTLAARVATWLLVLVFASGTSAAFARPQVAAITHDERLLPKIRNVASRFSCRTERAAMHAECERISLHFQFTGDAVGSRDARRPMNLHPHVSLTRSDGLARVESHPHSNRAVLEGALRILGRGSDAFGQTIVVDMQRLPAIIADEEDTVVQAAGMLVCNIGIRALDAAGEVRADE